MDEGAVYSDFKYMFEIDKGAKRAAAHAA